MINKLVDNAGKTDKRCLGVLGSTSRVKLMAGIWSKNAHLFEMVALKGLLDYAGGEVFTEKEFEAYRAGMAYIGAFMTDCVIESTEVKPKEEEF